MKSYQLKFLIRWVFIFKLHGRTAASNKMLEVMVTFEEPGNRHENPALIRPSNPCELLQVVL